MLSIMFLLFSIVVNVKRPSMEETVENPKPTQETKKTSVKHTHTSRTVKKGIIIYIAASSEGNSKTKI